MSVQYKPSERKDASSKMETDNISIACLENTVNINDLVMGSNSEKMVTLMLLIIGIQMCIELKVTKGTVSIDTNPTCRIQAALLNRRMKPALNSNSFQPKALSKSIG